MLNFTYKRTKIKATMRYQLSQSDEKNKADMTNSSLRLWADRYTDTASWWEGKMLQPLLSRIYSYLTKLQMYLPLIQQSYF